MVLVQIDGNQDRKREFEYREKLYYKPHFGPEETESQISFERRRKSEQKKYVKTQLNL